MKKFLVSILVAILFVSCESFAHATPVQIYDYSVDNFINDLTRFNVWGTEYYTYQGVKRCELYFGDSKSNIIRFRLNNDNSVSRILVTFPNDFKPVIQAGFIITIIINRLGLSESEGKNLMNQLSNGTLNFMQQNPYSTHFHEKYSVWCSKTQRYITLDVEMTISKVDYYFYASI